MNEVREIKAALVVEKRSRFAIVASRWNHAIVDKLLDGAVDALLRHGARVEQIVVVRAPGAFELPLVVRRLAGSGDYDAVIALGAIIRGATPHFEYVAGAASAGLAAAAAESGIPVAFGLLTTDSVAQAIERAGVKGGNKGAEAALVAVEMVNLMKQL